MTDQPDMTALVKPLVWEELPRGDLKAADYRVSGIMVNGKHMVSRDGTYLPERASSYAHGLAMAQADHTARILASLDRDALARMLADAERRGMEKAAEIVHGVREREETDHDALFDLARCIDAIRAAMKEVG